MLKSATHDSNGKATLTVNPTSSRPTVQKTYAEAVSSTLPRPRKPAPAPQPVTQPVASARATKRADVEFRSTPKTSSQNSVTRNDGTGTTRIEDGSSSASSHPAVSAAKTLPQMFIKDEAIGPRHDGTGWKVVQRTSRTSRVSDSSSRKVPEQDTSKATTKTKRKASRHSKGMATKDLEQGASKMQQTRTQDKLTTPDPPKDKGSGSFPVNLKAKTVSIALPVKKVSPKNPAAVSTTSTGQSLSPDQEHVVSKSNDSVPNSPEGVTLNKNLPEKKAFAENSATTSCDCTHQNPGSDQEHDSSKANDSLLIRPEIDTLDTKLPFKILSPKNIAAVSSGAPRLGPDQEYAGLLQGLADFVRNLLLEEVCRDSNTRKTSPVKELSALVPAAPADRPAIIDQTTQTDAEKKDRRDRLKDKYRERRRVKRQKEREQLSQQKSSRPKLNPMAKIFLPASAPETGLTPFSGSLLTA